MNHKKQIPLLILFVILLAACSGASYADTQSMGSSAGSDAAAYQEAPMEMPAMPADKTMNLGGSEIAFTTANDRDDVSLAGDGNTAVQTQQNRLIIRTGNLSLVVTDPEKTMADITQLVEQNEGWVVSGSLHQYQGDAKSGEMTVRVPAAGFNNAMEALKEMAVTVEAENVSGQDVTEEFVDLEARLGNLEATAARVRLFLDDTDNVEEALAVNQELSRLEGEIELIKGRMKYLNQSAAFSTISLYLMPDIASGPVQLPGWQPTGVAKEAVEALVSTLQGLATFAIWFAIYILPIALIIGIPAWLITRFVWRRWRQRKAQNAVNSSATD